MLDGSVEDERNFLPRTPEEKTGRYLLLPQTTLLDANNIVTVPSTEVWALDAHRLEANEDEDTKEAEELPIERETNS